MPFSIRSGNFEGLYILRFVYDDPLTYFSIVRHANGRDWWILMPAR